MKTKKKTVIISALLIMIMLFTASCNSTQTNTNNTGGNTQNAAAVNNGETAETTEADSYEFPALDCGGRDFTFLNPIQDWGFYTNIILESETGEVLDDAVFARNKTVEEKFNVSLKEIDFDIGVIEQKIKTTVLGGDNTYDVMYCPAYNNASIGALITQNLFFNLKDITELQLDQPWWNQDMQAECSVGEGNKVYFAVSDINIMDLQVPWCVYFNENMMGNLGLDLPYSLVKDGKWTYDRLAEYAKAGAQLNGAASFDWDHSSAAVYGLTAWQHGIVLQL